jgi:phospholipid/cholesterol/gamma-HCH transport system substrate-binding protein
MTSLRFAARMAALGVTGSLLAGCGGLSLQGVPLPGGADLGSHPYHVTAQFVDVQDLVPQASVKVNNVTVGQVKTVDMNPQWTANVVLELAENVKLPANAIAQLKQTTLLGEKYVELGEPQGTAPEGTLADGAVIPIDRSNRFPEAEEIFGALSLLLNGGGLGQVQNISRELNKALDGHETDTRALLDDLNLLVGTLDGERGNITKALDGVDKLSARLDDQRKNLDDVLKDLEPGLKVLDDQRPQLVDMLHALDKLSDTATDVVKKSHHDLVRDLEQLRPTLKGLAESGDSLPKSLEVLATPPFTDAAIKPSAGQRMNLDFQLDLDLGALLNLLIAQILNPPALPTLPVPLPDPLTTLPVAPLPSVVQDAVPDLLPHSRHSDSPLRRGLNLPGLGGN